MRRRSRGASGSFTATATWTFASRTLGYATTVHVSTRVRTLAEVWRGIRSTKDELRAGRILLNGSSDCCRAFPQWLLLSVYARIERAACHDSANSSTRHIR